MADTTAETVKKTVETAANTVKASAEKAEQFKAQAEKVQAAGAKAFRDGRGQVRRRLRRAERPGQAEPRSPGRLGRRRPEGRRDPVGPVGRLQQEVAGKTASPPPSRSSQARSIQELLELQTTWAKSATEAYLAEVTKVTDILTASVKDSFKPINERVTASVEKFQAAR